MLRIIDSTNARPFSMPIDNFSTFEAGTVMQLTVSGNQIVATVSNGTAPFGVVDDARTNSFSAVAWDEIVEVPAAGVPGPGSTLISTVDIKAELANPNVVPGTFISMNVDVQLIPRNGVVVFPAGTTLNYDRLGLGYPNAIRTTVRYTYQIPNVIGDDTTAGSNKCSIWYGRMILETDRFETNQVYPLNSNLFVSETGLFTTRQSSPSLPSIGIVTAPPTVLFGNLQLLWL